MTRFLPKIYLDSISFLAGIVLILVLLVLIFRYRSRVKSFFHRLSQGLLNFRDSLSVSSDEDYSKLIYRYVQSLHITADYFPLDNVVVPPKLIAPPPFILPGEKNLDSSLIQQSLGYDPLSPELSAEYFGPSFSLLEAISSNTNICLMGLPGTGKTTAIADCISSLVKGSNQDNSLSSKIPFYVKAHHVLTQFPNSNILEVLISALQANKIFLSIPNLPKYFSTIVKSGNAVLFIDDVDLLIPADTNRIANFINALCRSITTLQVVVTASPICLGNLVKAPLELISISPWGNSEKYTYLNKLAQIWPTILGTDQNQVSEGADICNSMLVVSGRFLTPLEFTLKSIAAFAGDLTGPKPAHAIDGYLNRLFNAEINETIQTLEIIALHALEQHKSSFSLRDVNRWLSNIISASSSNLPDDK
ncbi:MAG: AAA family ATPase, partial [Anaerolineales bacterium]|nr:AAA family ATPase [Anaerolineales bacterium]